MTKQTKVPRSQQEKEDRIALIILVSMGVGIPALAVFLLWTQGVFDLL